MKILGRRFWTWVSVWALSLVVKGEMIAAHRDPSAPQEAASTTEQQKTTGKTTHNVPAPMYTRHKMTVKSAWSKRAAKEGSLDASLKKSHADKTSPKIKTNTVKRTRFTLHKNKPK